MTLDKDDAIDLAMVAIALTHDELQSERWWVGRKTTLTKDVLRRKARKVLTEFEAFKRKRHSSVDSLVAQFEDWIYGAMDSCDFNVHSDVISVWHSAPPIVELEQKIAALPESDFKLFCAKRDEWIETVGSGAFEEMKNEYGS